MAGSPNPYSNVVFRSNVDWEHVDPVLLGKLNRIAKARGEVVDVFSGYRSPDYNRKVGGAGDSQHTHGRAVDAYVGGKPIGEVWSAAIFKAAGLRSGNQPNFFNGKPDPEHVDLGLDGSLGGGSEVPVTSYGGEQTAPPPGQPVTSLAATIGQDIANAPTIGSPVGPNVLTPNDVTQPLQPQNALPPRFDTWRLLSQLPGASPDTMRLTELANLDAASG